MDYIDYITGNHSLYDRYYDDWKLCINSWYGGTEYKDAKYLRAYQVDFNTPNETVNTYETNSDGSVVNKIKVPVTHGLNQNDVNRGGDTIDGSFYGEKLNNTPLYNYVKLIVAEYNALLYRNAPQRILPDMPESDQFVNNVDKEGSSLNEFMSLVDMMTTIYGVVHVGCYKPLGSDIPKWQIHTPLDVTNWSYKYALDGSLMMDSIVIKIEDSDHHDIYRHITPTIMETIFVGKSEDEDYYPPVDMDLVEEIDDGVYKLVQENELGYIPVKTIYQSTKVYNNIGTTVIQDVAQIQRSIYGDMAEIYAGLTYSSHPTLVVDETTEQMNDGQIGSEPGSVIRVQSSLTGDQTHVYQFVSPQLDNIKNIKELVDSKVEKLSQIAMLRSEDMIKSSSSGYQMEVYDDKLASLIRRKATNLENAEANLWEIWADWMNVQLPEDFSISYSKQYNRKALEHEIKELTDIMGAYQQYEGLFSSQSVAEEFATQQEAETRAEQLGGRGSHSHTKEDGTVIYMAFTTHEELEEKTNQSSNELKEDLRDKIRQRMIELVDSTSTSNSL